MITLAEFKNYLQISETENDPIIQGFINSAIVKLGAMCNRNFTKSDYTEIIQSNVFKDMIYLKNTPINSVTTLQYWDGTAYSNMIATPDTISDSVENLGEYLLLRKGYYAGDKNLKVVYNAGYKFVTGTGRIRGDIGTTVIQGEDTLFTTEVTAGDYLTVNGNKYLVTEVVSNTGIYIDSAVIEDIGLSSYTISNVPDDLRQACFELSKKLYDESPLGKDMLLRSNENNENDSATFKEWDNSSVLSQYKRILI